MGIFSVEFEISGLAEGAPRETVRGIVDTGALYTQIPRPLADRLGLHASEKRSFRLADGSTTERELAGAVIKLDERHTPVLIVLGPPDAPVLFGATTMEGLGLKPDPIRQVLEPTTLYLLLLNADHR
ncbi:MAG: aspartyl protease family protein [Nitrospirae bacterium]|nr:aspartyl protease family protein [Nitrospirota bacterium]